MADEPTFDALEWYKTIKAAPLRIKAAESLDVGLSEEEKEEYNRILNPPETPTTPTPTWDKSMQYYSGRVSHDQPQSSERQTRDREQSLKRAEQQSADRKFETSIPWGNVSKLTTEHIRYKTKGGRGRGSTSFIGKEAAKRFLEQSYETDATGRKTYNIDPEVKKLLIHLYTYGKLPLTPEEAIARAYNYTDVMDLMSGGFIAIADVARVIEAVATKDVGPGLEAAIGAIPLVGTGLARLPTVKKGIAKVAEKVAPYLKSEDLAARAAKTKSTQAGTVDPRFDVGDPAAGTKFRRPDDSPDLPYPREGPMALEYRATHWDDYTEESLRAGKGVVVHSQSASGFSRDYIDDLIATGEIQDPVMLNLANKLKSDAVAGSAAIAKGDLGVLRGGKEFEFSGGAYNNTSHTIVVSERAGANTVIHEVAHAGFMNRMRKDPKLKGAVQDLYDQTEVFFVRNNLDEVYGLKSIDEFVAEAWANPQFREQLSRIKYTDPNSGIISSMKEKFLDMIATVLGLEKAEANVLVRIMDKTYEQLN